MKRALTKNCFRPRLWLALAFAPFMAAQSSPAPTKAPAAGAHAISLAEARQTAFERNWDLLAAKSGIDAATAQLIVAKEFPNPTLSLSTGKIGTHDNGTLFGNGLQDRAYDSIAAVSQLIEIGGKRRDRRVSARAGITGARARFLDAKRTLDQGVTKAYVAAALAGQNVNILKESAGYLRREADIAEARFKAGDLSDSDKKQIEINAEQFELQAKAAETTAVQARLAVELLMGVSHATGDWLPSDSLDALVQPASNSIPPDTNGNRPDVLAAEADLRKSEADLKLQKAVRIPDPTFTAQVEHDPPGGGIPGGGPPGTGPAVNTVGFGVSFPLPLWSFNRGNIKAAEATRDQAVIALEKARAQVVSDIASAEAALHEAFGRWTSYRDVTGPKAAKVRESVGFAYEKGGTSLVDLLDAERTANDVRLATAQAMSDTANAAADLAAARTALSNTELNSQK